MPGASSSSSQQVSRRSGNLGLVRLLGVVPGAAEVAVEDGCRELRPAHPCPEPGHKLFHTGDPSRPADKSTVYNSFRRYLADADIPHFPGGPHIHSLRHGFAVANLRRWAADGADLMVMLPYLSAYMGHADLRGTQYYLQLTADAHPEVAAMASAGHGGGDRDRAGDLRGCRARPLPGPPDGSARCRGRRFRR